MRRNRQPSMGGPVILFFVLLNAIVLKKGFIDDRWYQAAYLTLPLLLGSILFSARKTFQKLHSKIKVHETKFYHTSQQP